MNSILNLLAELELAFLSFIIPIVTLVLSLNPSNVKALKLQYEEEQSSAEKHIASQLKKLGKKKSSTNTTDATIKNIQSTLKDLKKSNNDAKSKLFRLKPEKQIIALFLPILISFVLILLCFIFQTGFWMYTCFSISMILFIITLINTWKTFELITELTINGKQSRETNRVQESLDFLKNEITKGNNYLKNVCIRIADIRIDKNGRQLNLSSDIKVSNVVSFINMEKRMAKNIQVGIILPEDFLIEKKDGYSVYKDGQEQIVRYELEIVQGETDRIFQDNLDFTPLTKGEFEIRTFVKAENIESFYRTFKIVVA